jgi:molybdenum cofactor biosynthesis enzyme MoaA
MPLILLNMLGFGKSLVSGLVSWLSKRSLAEIGCLLLAVIALVEFIQVKAEKRHSAKVEDQLRKCSEVQKRLQAESKAQQKQVSEVHTRYVKVTQPEVEKRVKRIEDAPNPPDCKTPNEVLQADV